VSCSGLGFGVGEGIVGRFVAAGGLGRALQLASPLGGRTSVRAYIVARAASGGFGLLAALIGRMAAGWVTP